VFRDADELSIKQNLLSATVVLLVLSFVSAHISVPASRIEDGR
jgi:hypothetical protein